MQLCTFDIYNFKIMNQVSINKSINLSELPYE